MQVVAPNKINFFLLETIRTESLTNKTGKAFVAESARELPTSDEFFMPWVS